MAGRGRGLERQVEARATAEVYRRGEATTKLNEIFKGYSVRREGVVEAVVLGEKWRREEMESHRESVALKR